MASNDKTITIYGKKRTFRPIDGKYYEVKNGKVAKNPSTSFLVLSNLPKLGKPKTGASSSVKARQEQRGKTKTTTVKQVGPTPRPKSAPKKVKQEGPKPRPKAVDDRGTSPKTASNRTKLQKLLNTAAKFPGQGKPRDTSIKGLDKLRAMKDDKPVSKKEDKKTKPKSRGPVDVSRYKAPTKTASQKAIEAIRKRNEKAKNPLSKAMLNRIEKKLKEGGKPVYKDGIVVGVTHKGLIGTVYTGRPDSNPFQRKKKK
tara:strand:+ start:281 stop:1048 length:768 start_codon:yes stop_codon:yes gene_type:complete